MSRLMNCYVDWRISAMIAETRDTALKAIDEEYKNSRKWVRELLLEYSAKTGCRKIEKISVEDGQPPRKDHWVSEDVFIYHNNLYLGEAYLSEGSSWVICRPVPGIRHLSVTHWAAIPSAESGER